MCLAGGYAMAGKWAGAAVAILAGTAWLLVRKYRAGWILFLCLLVSVVLAVAGLLTGSPAILMICGSAFALAAWDLLLFNSAMGNSSPDEQTRQYENSHLQTLALALGSGLLVALLGRLLSLKIPFLLLAIFITLAMFGLERVWGSIKKTG
jgi:hypothetical protein